MTRRILPALASAKLKRVLFVGCKPYTARYGKQLTRNAIEYWTTDIDPAAAIWGEKDHHIVCDVKNINHACLPESFDAVLLNGVLGTGVDEESEMNVALASIARILRPNGILLIGWNSQNKHPDPMRLEAVKTYFRREEVLSLPLRKTFPGTDHVYDWLTKTSTSEANSNVVVTSGSLV
jgi:SAM-dependent methyltransferase